MWRSQLLMIYAFVEFSSYKPRHCWTRVVDTYNLYYSSRSPSAVLYSAEIEKKRKYTQACLDRRATFTLLSVSVDSLLGMKLIILFEHLVTVSVWNGNILILFLFIGLELIFCLLFFELHCFACVLGSHTKWMSLGIFNGAPLPLLTVDWPLFNVIDIIVSTLYLWLNLYNNNNNNYLWNFEGCTTSWISSTTYNVLSLSAILSQIVD